MELVYDPTCNSPPMKATAAQRLTTWSGTPFKVWTLNHCRRSISKWQSTSCPTTSPQKRSPSLWDTSRRSRAVSRPWGCCDISSIISTPGTKSRSRVSPSTNSWIIWQDRPPPSPASRVKISVRKSRISPPLTGSPANGLSTLWGLCGSRELRNSSKI